MVVGGILGGVVFLGLIILLLIKLIICWISRMEVKEFENMRSKEALTSVSLFSLWLSTGLVSVKKRNNKLI